MRTGQWLTLGCLALTCALSMFSQQAEPLAGGNPALPLIHIENGSNSAAAQKAHYVVLVSLDGFRWDYAKRDNATHLLALGKQGVWAPEGMLPSYPSLTFPNHFTIVTGLYPEHHGLVANSFYDETQQARYAIVRRQGRDRRQLVQRRSLVESGREPGNAHSLPFLAGFGGRRLPASGPPGMRNSTIRPRPLTPCSRRASTMLLRCSAASCRSPALHHHLLLRARPRRPRIRPRRAGDHSAAVLKMDAMVGKLKVRARLPPAFPSIWSWSAITAWSRSGRLDHA